MIKKIKLFILILPVFGLLLLVLWILSKGGSPFSEDVELMNNAIPETEDTLTACDKNREVAKELDKFSRKDNPCYGCFGASFGDCNKCDRRGR